MTSADPRFMDTFDATWNTHNVPAIMEHFTNDAAAHLAPPPPPPLQAAYVGKDEVRRFVETLMPGFRVDSRDAHVQGDTIVWQSDVSFDVLRHFGVEVAHTRTEVTLRDGKVASFTATFTPETLAEFEAAARRAGQPA